MSLQFIDELAKRHAVGEMVMRIGDIGIAFADKNTRAPAVGGTFEVDVGIADKPDGGAGRDTAGLGGHDHRVWRWFVPGCVVGPDHGIEIAPPTQVLGL